MLELSDLREREIKEFMTLWNEVTMDPANVGPSIATKDQASHFCQIFVPIYGTKKLFANSFDR